MLILKFKSIITVCSITKYKKSDVVGKEFNSNGFKAIPIYHP